MPDTARVLIVDDNPDILIVLRTNLERAGYATTLAQDGRSALDHLREHPPDVMLVDLMMPGMDGWDVLEAVRETSDAPPVIVVSAIDSPAQVERAERMGAAGYVTKPFSVRALVDLIGTVVPGAFAPDESEAAPSARSPG